MLRYLHCLLFCLCLGLGPGFSQSFKFAHVTDTHVGGNTGLEDLERTVNDINSGISDLDFVIISGDITEFGSDTELRAAREAIEKIRIPWYVIPGNHDTNWSESGGNSFRTVFGAETFSFTHQGYLFVGTNSGPNMRMSPGQVPRENLVWLDSILAAEGGERNPIIYINHYPQDSSLNNWFDAVDLLKMYNVQLALCGHGHQNKLYDFEGIPGIMSRSNLRARDSVGAYNIVTINEGSASFTLRYPGVATATSPWVNVPLKDRQLHQTLGQYPRPDYSVNERYTDQIDVIWEFQDNSDVGAGSAIFKDLLITANTSGQVYAVNTSDGQIKWTFQTGGKVYSTPAVWKNLVLFGSSDHYIYCLDVRDGSLKWKYQANKAVLASPVIHKGIGYIGSSDGVFRAFDMRKGKLKWSFQGVKGYVSGKPLIYDNKIYFGSWGNDFYALDLKRGAKIWEWSNGSPNRMLSPAACYPVASNDRIFIVAPDRYMTALDAQNGQVIWRANKEKELGIRVRESMGLSEDGQLVYVKTMDGQLLGISTKTDTMEVAWKSKLQLPYELTPSAILARDGLIFVPSHSGLVSAIRASDGEVVWQYKISNAMVNPMTVLPNRKLAASTMDGIIELIGY